MFGVRAARDGEAVKRVASCPRCGLVFQAASLIAGPTVRRPLKDDVTVCLQCAQPLYFTGDGMHVRLPTAIEVSDLLAQPVFARVYRNILNAIAEVNRWPGWNMHGNERAS